jgi:predicted nucleic acid-binding protein
MFEQYADKTWGLVDCVSFLVMREMKITAVLGFDRHFVQAGFRLLEDT